MRIERLHLIRYGAFADTTLDFGREEVRLHVIHGPNEAGKSTIRTAVVDLLFGIHVRSKVGFRYGPQSLRIGADLRAPDGSLSSFRRRKGTGLTLMTAGVTETGLQETALQPFLRGMAREDFEEMFALDHEGLRKGGDRMLKEGGDLARSLVEAGTGLLEVGAALDAFDKELEEIGNLLHKSAGKPLWKTLGEFEKARDAARKGALRAEEWKGAEDRLAAAGRRREELARELVGVRERRFGLQRVRRVAPILRRLREARERLAGMPGLPVLPEKFGDLWMEAVLEQARSAERVVSGVRTLDEAAATLQRIPPTHAVLSLDGEITAIHGEVSLTRKAGTDAAAAQADVVGKTEELISLARGLRLEEDVGAIAGRIPSVADAAGLRELIDAAIAAESRAQSDADALKTALDQQRLAHVELDALPAPADVSAAEALIADLPKASDLAARVDAARVAAAASERLLATALRRLGGWAAGAEDLEARPFPGIEVVQRHEAALRAAELALTTAETDVRRLEGELAREDAELAAILSSGGDVPTRAAVEEVRARRDALWSAIRAVRLDRRAASSADEAALADEAPERLEVLTRDADRLSDRRADEASRVTKHETAVVKAARLREELRGTSAVREEVARRAAEVRAEWQAAWAGTDLAPRSPDDMRSWLQRRDEVLRAMKDQRDKAGALQLVEAEASRARAALLRAAVAVGTKADPEADLANLEAVVTARIGEAEDAAARRRSAQDKTATEAGRVAVAETTAARSAAEAQAKRSEMAEAMPGLGLGSAATPRQASAVLSAWEGIRQGALALTTAKTKQARATETLEGFRSRVAAAARRAGDAALMDEAGTKPLEVAEALTRLLKAARDDDTLLKAAEKAVSDAREALRKARAAQSKADAEVARLRSLSGAATDDTVTRVIADVAAAAKLREEIGTAERELSAGSDGLSETELAAEVEATPPDRAEADLRALDDEEARLRAEIEELVRHEAEARQALDGFLERRAAAMDAHDAALAAQEAAALAERWAVAKAGKAMLERAVEIYRADNQDPLLARGSEIFAKLAGTGANPFVRLDVSYPDGGRPDLCGIRADGSTCEVEGMSEGTRDQLFLALRLAAVERRVESGGPVPFLADDLFVTTDEERLERGLQALIDLGERTQVILFTHHRHVAEAARRMLGTAVQRLGAGAREEAAAA